MSLIKLLRIGVLSVSAALLVAGSGAHAGPIDATDVEAGPQVMRPDMAAYRSGLRALDQDKLDEAEEAFRESFKLNDQVVLPLLGIVEVARRRGDLEKAELHLRLAEEVAPDDPDVHFAKARYYIAEVRRREAEAALARAIELAPDRADLHVERGVFLTRDLGRHGDAVEAFDTAVGLDANLSRAHLGRGSALLALGDPGEAREALETAAKLTPADPTVWNTLARVATAENDLQAALAYYQRSINADPDSAVPYVGRGDVFATLGDLDAAVQSFEAGAAADPALSGATLTRLGMMHQTAGNVDAAVAAYEGAVAADDGQVAAMNNLAAIMTERGERLGEALAWARRAVALRPDIAHFEDTLGWVLYANGDVAGALGHVESAAAQLPNNPEVQYHLGVLREAVGDRDGARTALEAALRLSDSFPGAENARQRLAALR